MKYQKKICITFYKGKRYQYLIEKNKPQRAREYNNNQNFINLKLFLAAKNKILTQNIHHRPFYLLRNNFFNCEKFLGII